MLFRGFIFETLKESVSKGCLGIHCFNGLVQGLSEIVEHGLVAFFNPDLEVFMAVLNLSWSTTCIR